MYSSRATHNSQLLEVSPNAEAKQALLVIQQNFDTIWRLLNDLRGDISNLQAKIKKLGG